MNNAITLSVEPQTLLWDTFQKFSKKRPSVRIHFYAMIIGLTNLLKNKFLESRFLKESVF